jgi:hypothetical protein
LDGRNERVVKDSIGTGGDWGVVRPAVY